MQNPRLAERYAKSLMDIAQEQGKVETLYNDMLGIRQACNDSRDLQNLLKSPIIKADTKNKTMHALLESRVDGLTLGFIRLIIQKGREFFLTDIIASFIQLYKHQHQILDVTLTTAEPLDETMQQTIVARIQQQVPGMQIDLQTRVEPKLIGGFVIETRNTLFDASILRDLNDIKKQFTKNEYIPDIR